MQKRTREIIALVLLVVLCIGGISAMAWYILVGHNWNATATSIDDRIGNMSGYTVVLCEGSIPSLAAQYGESRTQPMLEEQNFGKLASNDSDEDVKKLTVEEAVERYLEKGSQVVTIHTDRPSFYSDPIVVPRNGMRIAIYSVSGPRSDLQSRNIMKSLGDMSIDFTICIVDDIAAVERGLGDVDMAICTDLEDAGEEGRYVGRTYVMGSPFDGQVGAVIVAPSGFLSSKMLDVT